MRFRWKVSQGIFQGQLKDLDEIVFLFGQYSKSKVERQLYFVKLTLYHAFINFSVTSFYDKEI